MHPEGVSETTTKAHSAEVDEHTFDSMVLEKSHSVPVLVDFWAAWCGPCQMLMPLLAKLAEDYRGAFFLAKVNTDDEQRLAGRYGVRSLPTVKLFKNGQIVGEFMGVQPERSIRELLDRHLPRPSDTAVDAALRAYEAGHAQTAIQALRQAVSDDPKNDRAKLQLARLLYEQGQREEGDQALAGVSAQARGEPEAAALLAHLEFLRVAAGAPSEDELMRRVNADPGDSEARYLLAARLILREAYSAGMAQLLEIVKRDRGYGEDAGRKTLLAAFNLLPASDERVREYRRLLAAALH